MTNLGLDVVNGVRGFDLKSDGLTREAVNNTPQSAPPPLCLHTVTSYSRLDEDLHLDNPNSYPPGTRKEEKQPSFSSDILANVQSPVPYPGFKRDANLWRTT
jgi:hypothetical protein